MVTAGLSTAMDSHPGPLGERMGLAGYLLNWGTIYLPSKISDCCPSQAGALPPAP